MRYNLHMSKNAHQSPVPTMGRISDRLKAQLDEMLVRHAQTDREIAKHIEKSYKLLDELNEELGELEAL